MSEYRIKNAAITRTGFDYQDLVGIDILIEYYRDPYKYKWVQLESEDGEFGALDDVVAALPDGTFELTQVKFTPRPDKYLLSWDWLLEKSPKGTSRLQKWATSLKTLAVSGQVKSACLRTNRHPDPDLAKSLSNALIDLGSLDGATRTAVETELGGAAEASSFFSSFEFKHSEPMIDRLEATLRGRLVPSSTNSEGWLLLLHQARRWASVRNEPQPDGRITHKHLTQIISRKRPQPLSQDFRIPDGYEPPSRPFHDDVMKRVTDQPGIWALWGSPGRGKSTYLSYAVDQLRKQEVPTIRHHYFLSLADSGDRNHFADIASSLMDQMVVRYGDAVKGLEETPTELRKWVEACAAHFAAKGKPFVVVVDGLDHVAREYADLSQMNQLFNALLPCPPNVTVLLGTQRVPDNHLPLRLVQHAPSESWIEVPPMDRNAVQRWVVIQHEAGRVLLSSIRSTTKEQHELGAIGDAFYDISLGHPLHLIYSFEAMVRGGFTFSPEEIGRLPSCPEGDIRKYYAGLWRDLSPSAKQTIHAMAGSGFRWTEDGLRRCFGPIEEIDHLLEFQRSGVAPFHGSLLAFAIERDDHIASFKALLPKIAKWLKNDAPKFQRWGWYWIIEALNGDERDLLNATTRRWVIDSLVEGWPPAQIIEILSRAEELAFSNDDYVRTTELRALKTRVDNGPEFQVQNFGDFSEVAIRTASNIESVVFSADQLGSLGSDEILTLVKTVPDRSSDIIEDAFEELRRRVNLWIELRHHPDRDFELLVRHFLEVAAISPQTDAARVIRFLKGFRVDVTRNSSFRSFVSYLRREKRVGLLVQAAKSLKGKNDLPWRFHVEDALVVVASATGEDVSRAYSPNSQVSPLLSCWRHFHKSTANQRQASLPDSTGPIRKDYEYGRNLDVEDYFVSVFFTSLANSLYGYEIGGAAPVGWSATAFQCLTKLAKDIAMGRAQLSFATPYYAARNIEPVRPDRLTDPEGTQYSSFVHALREIAIGLHALKSPAGRVLKVSGDELRIARASKHWNEDSWMAAQIESNLPLLEPSLAQLALDAAADDEARSITEFNQRADRWIELSRYALLYDLPAKSLLARAANCLIGYGWRKDPWIYDVLDAVEDIHVSAGVDVIPLLEKIVPIVEQITEFTDGKGTNHARTALIETVARVCPERLIQFYSHHIAEDDYHLAETALEKHIELVDFAAPDARALARTLVEFSNVAALDKRADPEAKALAEQQIQLLGGMPTDHAYQPSNNSSDIPRIAAPDPTKYKVSEFARLMEDLGDYRISYEDQRAAAKLWLRHWVSKGRAKQALAAIRAYFEGESHSNSIAEDALNEAFEASLGVEGRDESYHWLVRAHIARHGWQTSWTSEAEINRRLEAAASHFPERWKEYIRDTSDRAPYWKRSGYSFAIGYRYLVRFLLLVGQTEIATNLTKNFVDILVSEVSDQPIPPCPWFR
ncbi:hypothetical protein [Nitratireductor sp. L15S-10]|uniref:hypothetical protein n=1 Tax=Nitratireductor sp. L15S-10 TaxID=3034028 RepID=UPI003857E5FA